MEVVFTKNIPEILMDSKVYGIYGDLHDLASMGVNIEGIEYDDNWTVKRFLNGLSPFLNKRMASVFNYLHLDMRYLNVKIKDLSKTNFKYVLLAYLLLNNKKIIIFDYFDVGLIYKEQKELIKIINNMKKDGIKVIFISKDLVFLNQLVDNIVLIRDKRIVFNDKMENMLMNEEIDIDEPEIIKFIKLANKNTSNLQYTLDSKELLKDIYRSVG